MPDDHSNADDSADLYGQDAYDDDATRNEMADESLAERDRTEYDEDAGYDDEYGEDDDGSWWDEGLIGLLLVAGAILFFFPEPSTSAVGMLLIGIGVVAWVIDALT